MKAPLRLKRIARRFIGRDQPIILMYHRVAHVAHDPWELAVWPERFCEQIEALTQLREVVPLCWLAAELARGRVPKKVAVVTFDDGYVDLLTEAKPVLERYACPATMFLVTGAIGSGCAFWWDDLFRILFEPSVLPSELEIDIAGRVYRWPSGNPRAGWRTGANRRLPAASRDQLHDELWRLLRPLRSETRQEAIAHLGAWAGVEGNTDCAHRPLNAEEVRRLAAPGFIDIGAHTVTHPALVLLDDTDQRAEIEGSRRACEELIGERIEAFAYPYGDFDDTSVECVRDVGFVCACTIQPSRVSKRSDPMRLPRIGIGNWHGADLARWIARGL